MTETFGDISNERQWEWDREIEICRDFIDSKGLDDELVAFARKAADDEVIYALCSGHLENGDPCPFFVDANSAFRDSTPEHPLAEFIHLTRGDASDNELDDHEPIPGEMHELSWWREHGPDRVKERFTEVPS